MSRKVEALRKVIAAIVGSDELVDILVRENQGTADHIDAIASGIGVALTKLGEQLDELDTRIKALEGNG